MAIVEFIRSICTYAIRTDISDDDPYKITTRAVPFILVSGSSYYFE